ncbi:MAG: hypothetical protein QXU32_01690 [Nitrososphaerales archaeon]
MAQPVSSLDNLPRVFRVGGSGFTAFQWQGHVIGFAQSIAHQSPQPVAAPVPIQPLDQQYPMQIIVPAAIGPGTLTVRLFEMYNKKIWDQIMQITDTKADTTAGARSVYNDLSEIFLRLSALNKGIICTKVVYPPNAGVRGGVLNKTYADVYYNCVITDIRDDEAIEIGTMEVIKEMTIQYTHARRISDSRVR